MSDEASAVPLALEGGGPAMWEEFMAELREEHLGTPADGGEPGGASVTAALRDANEEVLAGGAHPTLAGTEDHAASREITASPRSFY